MKIIVKEVGEDANVMEITRLELEDMQALVGGLIEPIYIDDFICWCNEEGKILGMDVNVALTSSDAGKIIDNVHGDIFFTNEEESKEGLSRKQIDSLLEKLNNGVFTFARSDLHIVPILTL